MGFAGGSRTRAFWPFLPAEALLWAFVGIAAAAAVLVGLVADDPAASPGDYMRTYALLSPILAALLAFILVSAARRAARGAPLGTTTVALPAFLVATLLHIAVWGVAASRWLVSQQAQLGTSLWTFVHTSLLPTLLLCTTYALKLRRTPEPAPRAPQTAPRIWLPALSALLAALLVLTTVGAAITAEGVDGNWFPGSIAVTTYLAAAASVALLLAALLLVGRVTGTRASGWRVALGPFVAGAAILATALAALLLLADPLRADFRWNTGVVLFVSYGSALLPSYVVVAVLRLVGRVRTPGTREK